MCLHRYINVNTPISSPTFINESLSKPFNTISYKHGLAPKYLLKQFNSSYSNQLKIRIPKNSITFGDVGYKFEIHVAGFGRFIGEITGIRQDAENNKDRRYIYFEDDDIEDMILKRTSNFENNHTIIFISNQNFTSL